MAITFVLNTIIYITLYKMLLFILMFSLFLTFVCIFFFSANTHPTPCDKNNSPRVLILKLLQYFNVKQIRIQFSCCYLTMPLHADPARVNSHVLPLDGTSLRPQCRPMPAAFSANCQVALLYRSGKCSQIRVCPTPMFLFPRSICLACHRRNTNVPKRRDYYFVMIFCYGHGHKQTVSFRVGSVPPTQVSAFSQ